MYCKLIPIFSVALLLGACGGSGDEASSTASGNKVPTLSLAKITINPIKGQPIELKATANDADGIIASVQWLQNAGPEIAAIDMTGESLLFELPAAAHYAPVNYEFNVTATDNEGASVTKTIAFSARNAMNENEAARLLQQGTMGPTLTEINQAQGLSEQQWLTQQMALPISYHRNYLSKSEGEEQFRYINRIDAWWKAVMQSDDQLRQRVAFALSQILVVSDANSSLRSHPEGMIGYYDLLLEHSFGNYRELLEDVTLSPVMGTYLSHLGNEKANEAANIRPDENYAREVMQLFTIGLEQLNLDGSAQADAQGQPIATYEQEQIQGFARVFTGWNFAGTEKWWRKNNDYINPMEAFSDYHSDKQKVLLNGEVIPAGYGPEESMQIALDNLFNHPNVGPFISKQLIKRLITSNPTPQYVERVATVFNDNGEGVRGDLAALVAAIYLDDEARHYNGVLDYYGKLKEPLLKTVHMWRTLEARSLEGIYKTWNIYDVHGQGPLMSPSVFNFYSPNYQPASLRDAQLTAPELEIASDANLIGTMNALFSNLVWSSTDGQKELNPQRIYLYIHDDMDFLEQHGIEALLAQYNVLYYAGAMSETTHQALVEVSEHFKPEQFKDRVAYILYTIAISPEFNLQY